MYYKLTKFLVLGLSKSGISATKLLLSEGGKVYIYDDSSSDAVKKNISYLVEMGAEYANDVDKTAKLCDVLVLSPGVPLDNRIALLCKSLGKRIIGEMELASSFTTNPIIAVTGTNGKTTTCSMIDWTLKTANRKSVLVGNIGSPLSDKLGEIEKDSLIVAEVSSYQLETVYSFSPHIAMILNVTPDHLKRHYNMENYTYVKSRILSNLRESEYAVLNFDDEIVKRLEGKTKGKTIWVSTKTEVEGGYAVGGKLYYNGEFIMNESELDLMGEHNVYNALFTICACKLIGVESEVILRALHSFKGVRHRIEFIRELNGVKFYNDSKSTNPDSCLKAVETMKENTVLIMGGYDKNIPFKDLFDKIKNCEQIKSLVFTGQTRNKMFNEALSVGLENISVISNFDLAIKFAYMQAKSGENVLFSPACSSFDEFTDYEERGDRFRIDVEEL